jgi:hypothetical protein
MSLNVSLYVKYAPFAILSQSSRCLNLKELYERQEPGSSVSIMSDCGLVDWAIGLRSPAEAEDYSSSLCVQTGSEAHPASCPIGTGCFFSG